MIILNNREARLIADVTVKAMADYIYFGQFPGVVLGVSGGIDSSVMAALGLKAIEKLHHKGHRCTVHYDFIDIESPSEDLKRARLLAHELGFVMGEHNYTQWYQSMPVLSHVATSSHRHKFPSDGLKQRLRMAHLYELAQASGGIVLDTSNLSKHLLGNWTRHGDEGDIKVIQHLTSVEVRDLGEYLGLPVSILSQVPEKGAKFPKMDYLKSDYCLNRLIQAGFDINGILSQLKDRGHIQLMEELAVEVNATNQDVLQIATQALSAGYKRKYGFNVANLVDRTALNLPIIGSGVFHRRYLEAIKKEI